MRNRAKCQRCDDVIESTHRHDFKMCSCGAISVDGGSDYWKGSGRPEDFMRLDDSGKELSDERDDV